MARKRVRPAQIKIRLPEKLRRDLEREAAKNNRTLNGEIVYRLTEPFVQADRKAIALEAAVKALDELMGPTHSKAERDAQRAGFRQALADFTTKTEGSDK